MTIALYGLPAPAKLNLFLEITGRRHDGYHLLESIFELIDFQDHIDLVRRNDDRIVLRNPRADTHPDQDLTVRAAKHLAQKTNSHQGVTITLHKRIPMGAGLGGGSSDAATVLLGLNRLWSLNRSRDELLRIGKTIGADVPFFLFGQRAYVEGTGDELTAMPAPEAHYVLVVPPHRLSSFEVFRQYDAEAPFAPPFTGLPHKRSVKSPIVVSARQHAPYRNALQAAAVSLCPTIGLALQHLDNAAPGSSTTARITGSGSCVFRSFLTARQARTVRERLVSTYHQSSPNRAQNNLSALQCGAGTLVLQAKSIPEHHLRDWV